MSDINDWFAKVFAPDEVIPEVKLFVDGVHTHTLLNVTGPIITAHPPDSVEGDIEVITITVEEKPK